METSSSEYDTNCNNDDESVEENKEKTIIDKSYTDFTIINTNAHSLCPKIRSLLDCFEDDFDF